MNGARSLKFAGPNPPGVLDAPCRSRCLLAEIRYASVRREPADLLAKPGNGPIGEPDQLMKWIRMKTEAKMAKTTSNLLRESKLVREWLGDLGVSSVALVGEVEVLGIDEPDG